MEITIPALEATQKVRWALSQIEKGSIAGRIIQFLYQINLDGRGRLKPGTRKEANMESLVKGAQGLLIDIEESDAKSLVIALGLEWTGVSTCVTTLCQDGFTVRRPDGRARYISLIWDLVKQLHEAQTTGRVVPADQITIT